MNVRIVLSVLVNDVRGKSVSSPSGPKSVTDAAAAVAVNPKPVRSPRDTRVVIILLWAGGVISCSLREEKNSSCSTISVTAATDVVKSDVLLTRTTSETRRARGTRHATMRSDMRRIIRRAEKIKTNPRPNRLTRRIISITSVGAPEIIDGRLRSFRNSRRHVT